MKLFLHDVLREYTVVARSMRRTLRSKLFIQSVKVYLYMYHGNIWQNPLCVASCATKDLSISPRFSPTIFCCDASSGLLQAHLSLYSSRLYAHNPVFEIVHEETLNVCPTHICSVEKQYRIVPGIFVQLV